MLPASALTRGKAWCILTALAVGCVMAVGSGIGAASALAAAPGSLIGTIANTGAGTRLFGTAAQADGKVVAVGQSSANNLLVARFTSSGAADGSFGNHGVAEGPNTGAPFPGSVGRAVAVQTDGKIVVVGSSGSVGGGGLLVERFNANGSADGSFGHGGAVNLILGSADGYAVAIQPDGKILAGGAANSLGTGGVQPRVVVVRLTSSGSVDTSFAGGGTDIVDLGPESAARGLALQPDGKIVLAGYTTPGLQVPLALVARLTSSGALDPSFAGTGSAARQFSPAGANSAFYAVAVQSDGKIVAGGATVAGGRGADALAVRFTSSGGLDGSFGSGGVSLTTSAVNSPPGTTGIPGINGLAIAPNGDVIGAGYSGNGPFSTPTLWALTSRGSLDSRFGSGGTASATFGSNRFGEFGGVAIAPTGDLVAVGDSQQAYQGAYTGIAARFVGFGAPPPPPVPSLKVTLSGISKNYKTSNSVKHGLKLGVACNQACSIKMSLGISSGTARKLRILSTITKCSKVHGKKRCRKVKAYTSVTLASARVSRSGAGTSTITLRLKDGKALSKAKSFGASLAVSVTSTASRKSTTIHKGLSFKR